VLVGTTTFGKGSVQTIIALSDGSGLRLTTAKYFTPKERSIHAVGIVPDIVVDGQEDKGHRVIREQDLLRRFENGGEDVLEPPADVTDDKKGGGQPSQAEPQTSEGQKDDPQLAKAIELLKSWRIFRSVVPPGGLPSVADAKKL
jgi:carboxyl-terminal processing protease